MMYHLVCLTLRFRALSNFHISWLRFSPLSCCSVTLNRSTKTRNVRKRKQDRKLKKARQNKADKTLTKNRDWGILFATDPNSFNRIIKIDFSVCEM